MNPAAPEPDAETVHAMESQARSRLNVACELHTMGHFEDAVSRAYYAAFHAASLLFYCTGRTFSSHAQLVGAFNKEFVFPGLLPGEMARSLRDLYELRQTADYDVHNSIAQSESEGALKRAETFVNQAFAYSRTSYPKLFEPME